MVRLVKRACDCRTCRAMIDAEFRAIVAASFTDNDTDAIARRTIAEYSVARLYAFLCEEDTDDGS
jgi:hypothetical protein